MKNSILTACILLVCMSFCKAQQNDSLHILCKFPAQLKAGAKLELPVQVRYSIQGEKTGTVSFEIINEADHQSVDGWFINIFPFQYFTTIAKESYHTKFPFTVPSNFSGKIKLILRAACNQNKDSVARVITIIANKKDHE